MHSTKKIIATTARVAFIAMMTAPVHFVIADTVIPLDDNPINTTPDNTYSIPNLTGSMLLNLSSTPFNDTPLHKTRLGENEAWTFDDEGLTKHSSMTSLNQTLIIKNSQGIKK